MATSRSWTGGLFREIGFSPPEIERFVAGRRPARRELIDRKLAELAGQQHGIEVARSALEHGLACPAEDHLACSRFWSIIENHQRGLSFADSHARAH